MACMNSSCSPGGTQMCLMAMLLGMLACDKGTPGPSNFSTPYDSTPPDTLLAYINTLKFDEREWAGDAQRLMVGTCPASCSHGPLVRIEPEQRAHKNRPASLQSIQGRIIARMINNDSIGYSKYNLGDADTVYWAVSRVVPTSGDTAFGVSMYISVRGLRGTRSPAITSDTAIVEKHSSYEGHKYYPKEALAQWVWSDTDETKWGYCGDACCR